MSRRTKCDGSGNSTREEASIGSWDERCPHSEESVVNRIDGEPLQPGQEHKDALTYLGMLIHLISIHNHLSDT